MIDEFGAKERLGRELFDFLGVFRVVVKGAGAGLGKAGGRGETQSEKNDERVSNHGAPQGKTIAEDYIGYSAQRRNPMVDDERAFGL
jgi:hypothetical protein